jgi:N-acetylglutamate synthase-like GNAT family acetyltransferase
MKIYEWNGDNQIIVDFYKTCDYEYHPKEGEKVIVAQDDNKIIGVVRLSWGGGLVQLRGMQIHQLSQGNGIGSEMLKEVEKLIKNDECYLVGYPHLEKFYGLIGFKTVSFDDVPLIIQERYTNAKSRFPETVFCIMKKT